MENFEYDLALQYCDTARAVYPSDVEVLETTGGLLLELGDVKRATQISFAHVIGCCLMDKLIAHN